MKSIKRIAIIILLVAIIMIIVGISFYFSNKRSKIKETIEEVNQIVLSSASKEELLKKVNSEKINSFIIMTGPDSYIAEKPSKDLIEKYNLSNYEKVQTQLVERVEKKIKDNFKTIMSDETFEDNNATVYRGLLKTYYQIYYLHDLQDLQQKIIAEKLITEEDNEILEYKAKIIAMKVIDNYLDIYDNKKEYCSFTVYIYDDEKKTADSFASYLNMLQGSNYDNDTTKKLEQSAEIRINGYYEEAKNVTI